MNSSFAVRLLTKTGSNLLAQILGHGAAPAPEPAAAAVPAAPAPAAAAEKDPLTDDQGVINVPKHHELSPQQLDHLLNRVHFDKKYRDLALEVANMSKAQSGVRPYVVG